MTRLVAGVEVIVLCLSDNQALASVKGDGQFDGQDRGRAPQVKNSAVLEIIDHDAFDRDATGPCVLDHYGSGVVCATPRSTEKGNVRTAAPRIWKLRRAAQTVGIANVNRVISLGFTRGDSKENRNQHEHEHQM